MLIRADWVCPIASPPIRDGAVYVHGHQIGAIGRFEEMVRAYPDMHLTEYDGCVLLPGLVNAHTHLALTVLAGVIPAAPFHEWLNLVVRAMRALTTDDLAASAVLGAHHAMASGTTVVGDIAYGPEGPSIAADTGLGGTFFWEVLGGPPSSLPERLASLEYPADPDRHQGGRLRYGITPHSPYTTGPESLRAAHRITREQHAAFALHVAESPAENELMNDGTGPLADVARRSAFGFDVPGTTSVRYLDSLGVLDGMLAIHCAELPPIDIPLLANRAAGVVLCPRSNAFLQVGPAPVERLERGNVRLALGTDSLASNDSLDLFEEARAIRTLAPSFSPERIIRMMTADGALALGLDARFGRLEPGMEADLAVFRVDGGDDPYAALLDHASRSTIEAVMAGGMWRVLSGQATFPSRLVEVGVRHAALKAAIAIQ